MLKKVLLSMALLAVATPGALAYTEVSCDTDPLYAANSCNQCFDGGEKKEGAHIGFLSDNWINTSDIDLLLFKEEQELPRMVNLDEENVAWSQTPSASDFWEYTPEFDALYSEEQEGFVLQGGAQVTWIKSALGYAYSLDQNSAEAGSNIGMLIYPLATHNIFEDGDLSVDSDIHNECVLYKAEGEKVVTPPTKLPETGPAEYFLLAVLAMILGFALVRFRRI